MKSITYNTSVKLYTKSYTNRQEVYSLYGTYKAKVNKRTNQTRQVNTKSGLQQYAIDLIVIVNEKLDHNILYSARLEIDSVIYDVVNFHILNIIGKTRIETRQIQV